MSFCMVKIIKMNKVEFIDNKNYWTNSRIIDIIIG